MSGCIEDVEEAIRAANILLHVISDRIVDLKAIWRRQRIDVEMQVRYYANGLFEGFYKVRRAITCVR